MTKQIDDGGPALPTGDHGCVQPWDGMSLRDYFAGQALAGILAGKRNYEIGVVRAAYQFADVMLEERKR